MVKLANFNFERPKNDKKAKNQKFEPTVCGEP
jgi:hypothetical protein